MSTKIGFIVLALILVAVTGPTHAQEGGVHLSPPEGPWTIYLTFDDGPSASITPQILDILDEYGVKATFFLHGSRIKGNEAIVQRILRDGHAIGNHLWRQDGYTSGSGATDGALRATWQKTEDEIVRALGPGLADLYHDQPVYLIRQPGGAARPFPVPKGIKAITYNWQVSAGDAVPWEPGPDDPPERPWHYLVGNVTLSWFEPHRYYSVYDYGDGTIILMHDVVAVLPAALPYIIEDLQANGASFGVLPRPGDRPGTMPVILSAPPEWYRQGGE
jgi:peptidoglycan/xylan/chitin deacetylase (PgdA/CDA1 family)